MITLEQVPAWLAFMRSKISFFVDDNSGGGAYETFCDAADDCVFLQVNDTTVRLWVDLQFKNASEKSG